MENFLMEYQQSWQAERDMEEKLHPDDHKLKVVESLIIHEFQIHPSNRWWKLTKMLLKEENMF